MKKITKTSKATKSKSDILRIGGKSIKLGESKRIELEVASLFDYTQLKIPVQVIRSLKPGPTMFISAAVHGDEINGVEIIKRLMKRPILKKLRGTLIVVPVVNVFGFNNKSRYLPDRRDLNRCFPGSAKGSMGSMLAHTFMKEIVSKCSYGIDFHTGAIHRTNVPQIRAFLDDQETEDLAKCFGVPVVIHSQLRDGSLREAARNKKVKVLLFEGGEALRFEEPVIKAGVKGCISVMEKVGMLPATKRNNTTSRKVYCAKSSYWVRAIHSGSFKLVKKLGDQVNEGDVLAIITDTFGDEPYPVVAREEGIIIGLSQIPLVNEGDAMIHVAVFNNSRKVEDAIFSSGIEL